MQYDVAALLGTITLAKKIKELEEANARLRNEIDMMKKG
jgi:hypothetical protein